MVVITKNGRNYLACLKQYIDVEVVLAGQDWLKVIEEIKTEKGYILHFTYLEGENNCLNLMMQIF